eukprot:PhM_4_TR1278/c2_g2_i6/m.84592
MPMPGHRGGAHPLAGIGARDALKALNSFPRGSAPGPSRLTARHLCETMRTGSVATSLARILKMIAHGYVHVEAREFYYGATLVALQKGNTGIRPIASGEVLRRAAAKLLCKRLKSKAKRFFLAADQVGVAVPAGADSLILAADSVDTADQDVIVKVDFANAFNSVSRALLSKEVADHFPELVGYFSAAYCAPTSLFFGDGVILSRAGVQQGDPLGPLLFLPRVGGTLERSARRRTRTRPAPEAGRLVPRRRCADDVLVRCHVF